MRSDKLGYNAPIISYEKKYYKYADPNYTITNIAIDPNDISILTESVEILKQFKDFSLFNELTGVIQKLEDKIYTSSSKQPAIIHLDKNEQLKGLEHLDILYQSILKKICLDITYKSFKAREASTFTCSPLLLKEFNNRWFLIAIKEKQQSFLTIALDRVEAIIPNLISSYSQQKIDGDSYYKNTIGVTVKTEEHIENIILKINRKNTPYILTKPLHHSQKIIETYPDNSVLISIDVHQNYELERLLLGFGEGLEVKAPRRLRRRMKQILRLASENYKNK